MCTVDLRNLSLYTTLALWLRCPGPHPSSQVPREFLITPLSKPPTHDVSELQSTEMPRGQAQGFLEWCVFASSHANPWPGFQRRESIFLGHGRHPLTTG